MPTRLVYENTVVKLMGIRREQRDEPLPVFLFHQAPLLVQLQQRWERVSDKSGLSPPETILSWMENEGRPLGA